MIMFIFQTIGLPEIYNTATYVHESKNSKADCHLLNQSINN